ncbi:MAG: ribosomal RNA small subunit methyltransferase A [Anaerolineales bacterium]|nr:ribosomal RNA small subunit methyltransferase A [Anaerolineales bacterium]
MNEIEPINISALMQKYKLRPKKNLGQNFLTDPQSLERIVEIADISPQDTVLEIGAGLGHLTRYLAEAAKRVVAVEFDERLIPPLREVLAKYDNVDIIQGDILSLAPKDIIDDKNYLVVANIPYYITSAITRHLLEAENKPRRLVLTVQREVAKRMCAVSGDMNILALSIQIYGEPYITSHIPAAAFHPPPKVDSASVRIDLYRQPVLPEKQLDTFFRLVRAGFQHKRKTLRNSLSAGLSWPKEKVEEMLEEADILARRRAETLSLPEWIILTRQHDKMKINQRKQKG